MKSIQSGKEIICNLSIIAGENEISGMKKNIILDKKKGLNGKKEAQ